MIRFSSKLGHYITQNRHQKVNKVSFYYQIHSYLLMSHVTDSDKKLLLSSLSEAFFRFDNLNGVVT